MQEKHKIQGAQEAQETLASKVFSIDLDYNAGEEIQLKAQENRKRPGSPIFIASSGKIGFPTINSVPVQIGDVVRGKIKIENDSYFFVDVTEVITREQ